MCIIIYVNTYIAFLTMVINKLNFYLYKESIIYKFITKFKGMVYGLVKIIT